MATPAYLKAFRAYLATPPNPLYISAMEEEYYLGGERAAVILQAANEAVPA